MIDSVRIFYPIRLHAPGFTSDYLVKTWSGPAKVNESSNIPRPGFSVQNRNTGYFARGENDQLRFHSISLSRLLHGNNGRLIKHQEELDRAMALFLELIAELGYPMGEDYKFTRVDLVWQFIGDPVAFVRAHRACRHPRIQPYPVRYEDRSLAIEGSEMRINIYDKALQRLKHNGDVVRVEVQLHGRRLMEELGHGLPVKKLDFADSYQAYRGIILDFTPPPVPKVSCIAELLAHAEREDWQISGVSLRDWWIEGKSKKTISRLRKEMSSLLPFVHQIDWSALLPAAGPPSAVELPDSDSKL